MTFGISNIVRIIRLHGGQDPKPLLINDANWTPLQKKLFDYTIGCHLGHLVEFFLTFISYTFLFPITFPEAKEWQLSWVWKIFAFNFACEFIFYGFWHWMTYTSVYSTGPFRKKKYNPKDQYASGNQLAREILFTTLGFVQSSLFQCTIMWLWATGRVAYYTDFWAYPLYSIFMLLLVTYFREFHFYWVHRAMHPWWDRSKGLADGDIGAFLYRHVHSLHHKSYNPGPFSGLCMHPVEHLIYYTTTLLCLVFVSHPVHFLYAKFHADIAPIGGHDGYADPGGGADFHWLHHDKYECNYGVPLVDFDRLFGTWVDYEDVVKTGSFGAAKEARKSKKSK